MTGTPYSHPPFDDLEEADPPTLFGSALTESRSVPGEWALIRYMGNPVGEILLLGSVGIEMGRARENQVCLPEPEVSRYHAKVELMAQGEMAPMAMLSDLGSTNGTFVNGRHVVPDHGPVCLKHGDVIRVGIHAFKVKHLDELERNYHDAVLAQTTVDHLTGLGNRASVLGFLEKHADLCRRHRRPLAVILCDLDHFKAVNDRHGHAVGDLVLKTFSHVVAARLRASDHVGRIGGEEFLIVLPETGGREAQAVAEDLRNAVAAEALTGQDGATDFRVTCCFGVVQMGEEDADGGSVLARADVALYRAKALGRNRVEFDGAP